MHAFIYTKHDTSRPPPPSKKSKKHLPRVKAGRFYLEIFPVSFHMNSLQGFLFKEVNKAGKAEESLKIAQPKLHLSTQALRVQ